MLYSRRQLAKFALAAVPATQLVPAFNLLQAAEGKPNSKVAGVQLGINVPYSFGGNTMSGDETLRRVVELGLSAVELRSQPVEAFMGAPAPAAGAARGAAGGARGGVQIAGLNADQQTAFVEMTSSFANQLQAATAARTALITATLLEPANRAVVVAKNAELAKAELALANARADALAKLQSSPNKLTPEQIDTYVQQNVGGARGGGPAAAPNPAAEELRKWRATVSMDKAKEFRKNYEDAGVLIEIVKFDGIFTFTDEVLDYCFNLTNALGGRAISCEISTSADDLKRLGRFADKHQMLVRYHGHTGVTPAIWEAAFSYAKFNGANVDLGHFVAGNNYSPAEFIKKYPERITHVHVKDKKLNLGPNMPFGQGDTPIKEILRMISANKWNIQATIEFEYPVPADSDRMTEIAKAVKYCREVLA